MKIQLRWATANYYKSLEPDFQICSWKISTEKLPCRVKSVKNLNFRFEIEKDQKLIVTNELGNLIYKRTREILSNETKKKKFQNDNL